MLSEFDLPQPLVAFVIGILFCILTAAAIAFFFPLRIRHVRYSNKLKSSRVRMALLRRLAVLLLPLAAPMAMMIPFLGLGIVSKTLLLCALVLMPAYAAHVFMKIITKKYRVSHAAHLRSGASTALEEPQYAAQLDNTQIDAAPGYKRIRRHVATSSRDNGAASMISALNAEVAQIHASPEYKKIVVG